MAGLRLLFVYNADSGLLNALKDAIHKLARPESYACSLCATTYGAVTMRSEWRDYVALLPYPALFLHRDEFHARFPGNAEALPAIFLQEGNGSPDLLVGAAEMPLGQSLPELMARLDAALRHQPRGGQAL